MTGSGRPADKAPVPHAVYSDAGRRARNHGLSVAEVQGSGARSIYLYVVIAARIYLLRRYAKNFKADLAADEKKALRQLAAHLKGLQ